MIIQSDLVELIGIQTQENLTLINQIFICFFFTSLITKLINFFVLIFNFTLFKKLYVFEIFENNSSILG